MEDLIKIDRRLLQDVQQALLDESRTKGIVCPECLNGPRTSQCGRCARLRELAWLEQELWRALQ